MPESPNEPAQPKDAPAEPATAGKPAAEPALQPDPPGPAEPPVADSATFSRCAACKNAEEINSAAGTLVCKKHNMLINAEADEIPDDCPEHEPKDSTASAECGVQNAE